MPISTGPDGTLPLPADYKSWPKFLTDIPKGEAKQVRDIYINPTGARTSAGQNFPNGTVMVMEIYKAKMDGDKLAMDMTGKPAKGDLSKVFVMGKEQGWGDKLPENLQNGDWAYAAYDATSKPLMEDFTKCRVRRDFRPHSSPFAHKPTYDGDPNPAPRPCKPAHRSSQPDRLDFHYAPG